MPAAARNYRTEFPIARTDALKIDINYKKHVHFVLVDSNEFSRADKFEYISILATPADRTVFVLFHLP